MKCLFCSDFPKAKKLCGHTTLGRPRVPPECEQEFRYTTSSKGRLWALCLRNENELFCKANIEKYRDLRAINSHFLILLVCNKHHFQTKEQIVALISEKAVSSGDWFKENINWLLRSLVEGGLLNVTT